MAENASKNPPTVARAFALMPRASIDTRDQSRRDQARRFLDDSDDGDREHIRDGDDEAPHKILMKFLDAKGDISELLPEGTCASIAAAAIREWRDDEGSITAWRERNRVSLAIAAQENEEDVDGSGDNTKNWPWEGASDVHYPLLTVGASEWTARAAPELIKGDQAVGIKTFDPAGHSPSPQTVATAAPPPAQPSAPGAPPTPDPAAQQAQLAAQQATLQDRQTALQNQQREARGQRVKMYMNWLLFYGMDEFQEDNDQLLTEIPVLGHGVMQVKVGQKGPTIDYCSPMRFTVHRDTRSLIKCPRITRDYDIHPVEIESGMRLGIYRDVDLPEDGSDIEQPRLWIEQWRYEDLDGDGLREPYIVTVDVDTQQCMRIEPAFIDDDVLVHEETHQVLRIERWLPFGDFRFMRDIKGRYYGTGLGKLLAPISDTVDTTINQLIDAGSAQIAGGGFIAAGVKMRGAGAGGAVWMEPGEYKVVDAPGGDLQQAVWERTVPQPSAVAFQTLQMLVAAGKDISATKDVITGDTPATAPVGTTMALQNQALTLFTSIFSRMFRGYTTTYRILFKTVQRFPSEQMRQKYKELTGGDLDEDFAGDGTDIQPIADPRVVTRMQKLARIQALAQWAEGALGQAAGMQEPGPAQEMSRDALEAMEVDRPDRFFAQVQPNPELVAKTQQIAADTALKQASAIRAKAGAQLDGAKTLREIGLAEHDTHGLRQEASRIASGQPVHEEEPLGQDGTGPGAGAPGAVQPGNAQA